MTKLDLDLLHIICQYVPVADIPKVVVSLYPGATNNEIQSVKSQLRNPHTFFQDIMDAVPTLMKIMDMTDTYLIGVRALSYFHYIKIEDTDPWEFICDGNHFCYLSFIDHLESQGVIWNHMRGHHDTDRMSHPYVESSMISISGHIYSNSKIVSIKLIWKRGDQNKFDLISSFGVTLLQCFITADGAFDRYGKLHAQKKFRLWKRDNYNSRPGWEPSLFGAMNICQDHNFKPISFETHRQYNPWTRASDVSRNIIDSECLYSRFSNMLSWAEFRVKYILMRWYESQYDTMPSFVIAKNTHTYTEWRQLYSDLSMPLMDKIIKLIQEDDGIERDRFLAPSWYLPQGFDNVLQEIVLDPLIFVHDNVY